MSINETSGNNQNKKIPSATSGADNKTKPGRELIAEGLNAEQVKQVLNLLKASGKINGIGTPSRDEIISPKSSVGGALTALGGLFQGGPMDRMLVDMTTEILQRRDDNNGKFDISITRIPLAGSPMGISEAAIAQVYPSDSKTQPVTPREFGELMAKTDSFAAPKETAARKLDLALREQPDSIDKLGKDLSYDELAIRLKSLVNNNRVNVIMSDGDEQTNEQAKTTTKLADDIERHLAKVKQAATNNDTARYSLSVRNYNNPKGLQGSIVAAHLQVDKISTPKGYTPKVENLTAKSELIAEGLEATEAANALKTLWRDRRMDTLSLGSYNYPSRTALFPSADFKGEDGKPLSLNQLFEALTKKHIQSFPGKKLDLILRGDSTLKRNLHDKSSDGQGFHVRVLADDYSDK
jgi:hypothetical protein